jgi:hypothetical protein
MIANPVCAPSTFYASSGEEKTQITEALEGDGERSTLWRIGALLDLKKEDLFSSTTLAVGNFSTGKLRSSTILSTKDVSKSGCAQRAAERIMSIRRMQCPGSGQNPQNAYLARLAMMLEAGRATSTSTDAECEIIVREQSWRISMDKWAQLVVNKFPTDHSLIVNWDWDTHFSSMPYPAKKSYLDVLKPHESAKPRGYRSYGKPHNFIIWAAEKSKISPEELRGFFSQVSTRTSDSMAKSMPTTITPLFTHQSLESLQESFPQLSVSVKG